MEEIMHKWKKCSICGGRISKKPVTINQEIDGKLFIIENVSAEVCNQCGEILYSPSTMRELQKLVWSKPEPKKEIKVPVLDMAGV